MRTTGILGLLLSILVIFGSLSMDTSVPTGNGNRVVNIGLMRDQSNYLNMGFVLFIGSIILVAVGGRKEKDTTPNKHIPPKNPLTVKGKKAPPHTGYVCPNCGNNTDPHADECSMCHASFSEGSVWKPVPKG